ncbi:hypothetical protein [Nocardia macrotermitis]|uniref:Uncharacterized protein n=1 Tax=Nocardia macrotermitis TaxID=2585198 RepID=A0A7K0DDA4_9NOCA|nr:hypothetical protein [Nocardia macrotermitis]MQY23638.1 hypothetical protein [Nocardia macrotermitis]
MSDDLNIDTHEAVTTSGQHHHAFTSFTGQVSTIAADFTVGGSGLSRLDRRLLAIPAEIRTWFASAVDSANGGSDAGVRYATRHSGNLAAADASGGERVDG